MSSVQELCDTVEARLSLVGLDAKTIERSPDSTIIPRSLGVDTAGERAMSLLDELGASTLERKLELHGTIGEGGMGLVRLGTQRALGREVAVKTIKGEHKSDHSVLKLLREAWITGALEHPNVVPVYDIALDADGAPLIILKKIEGVDWGSLMHDARTVRERFGADDLLEWNLRVFLSVCNAVRFAHSRKILHRDLKPENVMIGQFGEVYLADWGIAVSLEDDGSGRLPLASEAIEMAGTPLYMAPEMLGGRESRLSERTDIYLLGSILTEIVTGRPPHQGSSFMQLVAAIAASDPELPESVPDELARIIRRAMDPDPDARFENAEQLRLAVQAFLRHRDATRLAEHAERRMEELLALIATGPSEDREEIYRVFGECRFAFRHALEVWPENDAARRALDRTVGAMVEHELALGEPESARTLLAEMALVPAAHAARVEAARQTKAEEELALRRLHDDLDPSKGRRTRTFIALIMGLLWTFSPLLGVDPATAGAGDPHEKWIGTGATVTLIAILLGLGYWGRESMLRTAINRRLAFAALVAMSGPLVARLVAMQTGDSLAVTFHHIFLVWSVVVAMLASTVDWRLLLSACGYLAAYVVVPFIGYESVVYLRAAANGLLLLNVLLLWARPKEDMEHTREQIRLRSAERRRWREKHLGACAGSSEPDPGP